MSHIDGQGWGVNGIGKREGEKGVLRGRCRSIHERVISMG